MYVYMYVNQAYQVQDQTEFRAAPCFEWQSRASRSHRRREGRQVLDEDVRIERLPVVLNLSNHVLYIARFYYLLATHLHVFNLVITTVDVLRIIFVTKIAVRIGWMMRIYIVHTCWYTVFCTGISSSCFIFCWVCFNSILIFWEIAAVFIIID